MNDRQQQMAMPEVHIHTEAPAPSVKKDFPTEAAWAVAVTIIAATVLALVKGKK